MTLRPCSGCARHIRDARCSFCGHAQEARTTTPFVSIGKQLSRTALILGATLGASACGESQPAAAPQPSPQVETSPAPQPTPEPTPVAPPAPTPIVEVQPPSPPTKRRVEPHHDAPAPDRRQDPGLIAAYGGPPMMEGPGSGSTQQP